MNHFTKPIILGILAVIILGSYLTIPNAYSVTSFGPSKNLSNDSIYSTDPQVVVSGSKVYAVWTSYDGTTADILFKVSDDGGSNFGITKSLSSNAESTPLPACTDILTSLCRGYPQIALSGDNVYVIWQDNDEIDDDGDGVFNEDPSEQFNDDFDGLVSEDPEETEIDDDFDGLFSEDPVSGDDEIFFRKTTDDGTTFSPSLSSPAKNLSDDIDIAAQARIAATGVDVHVVCVGFDTVNSDVDIFYSRSSDSGDNFYTPIILSNNVEQTLSVEPDLAVAGNNVYVVWQEDLDFSFTFDIFFRSSTNNGALFGSLVNLFNNDGVVSENPEVAAAGDKVFVTWNDGNDGDFDIFFRRSTDNGANFDPDLAF